MRAVIDGTRAVMAERILDHAPALGVEVTLVSSRDRVLPSEDADAAMKDYQSRLEQVFVETKEALAAGEGEPRPDAPGGLEKPSAQSADAPRRDSSQTAISTDDLTHIGDVFTQWPEGFTVHPKLKQALEKRAASVRDGGIDWAHAESLAFASLLTEGTPIRPALTHVFASHYVYDDKGEAAWPAVGVNYTTKTQYLFRINKGVRNHWEHERINHFIPDDERPVPFERMIFIGDGDTALTMLFAGLNPERVIASAMALSSATTPSPSSRRLRRPASSSARSAMAASISQPM